jgi:hypothetical protein
MLPTDEPLGRQVLEILGLIRSGGEWVQPVAAAEAVRLGELRQSAEAAAMELARQLHNHVQARHADPYHTRRGWGGA